MVVLMKSGTKIPLEDQLAQELAKSMAEYYEKDPAHDYIHTVTKQNVFVMLIDTAEVAAIY